MIMNDCPRVNCLINERGKIDRTEMNGTETKRFYSCSACGCEWYVATDGDRTWTETLKERREV